MFLGFVFVCTLGIQECTRANAIQVVQIPSTFTNTVSQGFAGAACQNSAVGYARSHFDPKINRIGVNCELQP
jgi:hypothetical protein